MPMFYIPKPRQFHYQPRFYDPEKEKWEALKAKYAMERELEEVRETEAELKEVDMSDTSDADLAYFEQRVRALDREERQEKRGLTWKDLFRKREMPTFNYQPRFATTEETGEHIAEFKKRNVKIKRRFDITDKDYMKPIPATRILLYTMLVCLLLYWILF